jgi:hypothetical protein
VAFAPAILGRFANRSERLVRLLLVEEQSGELLNLAPLIDSLCSKFVEQGVRLIRIRDIGQSLSITSPEKATMARRFL